MDLAELTYLVTKGFPPDERFGLVAHGEEPRLHELRSSTDVLKRKLVALTNAIRRKRVTAPVRAGSGAVSTAT
jgi:hypothetical protein